MKGALRKRDTFSAYLHIAASMTGNLGKFSTEPAADGGRIRTKREQYEGRREGRRGKADVCRLPDKAGAGSKSAAANGFPDSNQRRGVGRELVGDGVVGGV